MDRFEGKQNPVFVQAYPAPPALIDINNSVINNSYQTPAPVSLLNPIVDEIAVREFLTAQRWPEGLQDTLIRNYNKILIRFFIIDDSGSMNTADGHKLITNSEGKQVLLGCSRWSELTKSLQFHADLSKAAHAPSEFRLLNGAPPLMIGNCSEDENTHYAQLKEAFDQSPNGGTPLCRHIREVVGKIKSMEKQLRQSSQKACVIIMTDGESSDGDIVDALRPLRNLPAWVVIRLCTDEDKVVDYWNSIDNELELDMDVLDDLCSEAQQVCALNPWLTYGDPLHKIRELGIPVKELDLLDECPLSLDQIRKLCYCL